MLKPSFQCYKNAFDTRSQAISFGLILKRIKGNRARVNKRANPYLCPHCDKWHITSQETKEKRVGDYKNKKQELHLAEISAI